MQAQDPQCCVNIASGNKENRNKIDAQFEKGTVHIKQKYRTGRCKV